MRIETKYIEIFSDSNLVNVHKVSFETEVGLENTFKLEKPNPVKTFKYPDIQKV